VDRATPRVKSLTPGLAVTREATLIAGDGSGRDQTPGDLAGGSTLGVGFELGRAVRWNERGETGRDSAPDSTVDSIRRTGLALKGR